MAEYNLSGLQSDVSSEVESAKNEFLDSIDDGFLTWVINSIDTSNITGPLQDPVNITLKGIEDVQTILDKAISDIGDFTLPDRPAELDDPIDRDTTYVFEEERLDDLMAGLESLYSEMAGNDGFSIDTGLSEFDTVQDAFHNTGIEAEEDSLGVIVDDIAIKWSADGYEAAPGSMSHDITKVINAFEDKRAGASQQVLTSIYKVIQANIQKSFENGLKIEKLHMDFAKRYTAFKYEKINAVIAAYIGEIEKVTKEINAPVMNIATVIKAIKSDNRIDAEKAKNELDYALADLNAYVSAVDTKRETDLGLAKKKIEMIGMSVEGYLRLFETYGQMFTGVNLVEQQAEE